MGIGRDDRVRVAPDVHVREFDGELVILDLTRGDYFGVNETGARLWQGLAAGRTPAEVAAEIASEFEIEGDRVVEDLLRLADELVARGLVVPL